MKLFRYILRLPGTDRESKGGYVLTELMVAVGVLGAGIFISSKVTLQSQNHSQRLAAKESYTEFESSYRAFHQREWGRFFFTEMNDCSVFGDSIAGGLPTYLRQATPVNLAGLNFSRASVPSSIPDVKTHAYLLERLRQSCADAIESQTSPGTAFTDNSFRTCVQIGMGSATQGKYISSSHPVYGVSQFSFKENGTNRDLSCDEFLGVRDNNPAKVSVFHHYDLVFVSQTQRSLALHRGLDIVMPRLGSSSAGFSADIKVNGLDTAVTVNAGETVFLTWTSVNVDSCRVTGVSPERTELAMPAPGLSVGPINAPITFEMICLNQGQERRDSVSVGLNPGGGPSAQCGPAHGRTFSASSTTSEVTATGACISPSFVTSGSLVDNGSGFVWECSHPQPAAPSAACAADKSNTASVTLTINGEDGPVTVPSGEQADIAWSGTNVSRCHITSNPTGAFNYVAAPAVGRGQSGPLNADTTFSVVCDHTVGAQRPRDRVDVVVPAPPPPSGVTANLEINSNNTILYHRAGDRVWMFWESANADECLVSPSGYTGISGSKTPAVSEDTTFELVCRNTTTGESASDSVQVVAQGELLADLIINGQANGSLTLPFGSSVTITWTSANATSCLLNPGGYTALENSGGETHELNGRLTEFVLTCENERGDSVTDRFYVYQENQFDPSAEIKINNDGTFPWAQWGSNISVSWETKDVESCEITRGSGSNVISTDLQSNGLPQYLDRPATYTIVCVPKEGSGSTWVGDIVSVCPYDMPDTEPNQCRVKFYNSANHGSKPNPFVWTALSDPAKVPYKLTNSLYASSYGVELDYNGWGNHVSCILWKEGGHFDPRGGDMDQVIIQNSGYGWPCNMSNGPSFKPDCTIEQKREIGRKLRAERLAPRLVFPPARAQVRNVSYTFQVMSDNGSATSCTNTVIHDGNVQ